MPKDLKGKIDMKEFFNKIIKENPVFVLLLGMCPTLATSTSVSNAIGMGLSATAVLICSNAVISALRKVIPGKIRIASYIVIIASFVTIVEMVLHAFVPALYKSLGLFIPLIVVNCIILGRAEAYASKNGVLKSALDGLAMGLGFTLALSILATVREILGAGTFLEYPVFGQNFQPATMMIMAPGGFIALGLILGIINVITQRKGGKNNG